MFCRDITYVPTQVRRRYFYLYLAEELLSRDIRCLACSRLHSNNGVPMEDRIREAGLDRDGLNHTIRRMRSDR